MTVNSQGVPVDALTSLEESGMEITKSLGRCQSINRYPYQTVKSVANPVAEPLQGGLAEPAARPGATARHGRLEPCGYDLLMSGK